MKKEEVLVQKEDLEAQQQVLEQDKNQKVLNLNHHQKIRSDHHLDYPPMN